MSTHRRRAVSLRLTPTPRLRWYRRLWRAVRYWATRQWDVGRARVKGAWQRLGRWLGAE